MRFLCWTGGLVLIILILRAVFIDTGVYNVAGDEPHWKITDGTAELRDSAARGSRCGVLGHQARHQDVRHARLGA